jgi:hypothetical protein
VRRTTIPVAKMGTHASLFSGASNTARAPDHRRPCSLARTAAAADYLTTANGRINCSRAAKLMRTEAVASASSTRSCLPLTR